MTVSNELNVNKVVDIFSDPRVKQTPLPLEILTLIFSHLSELDLQKGLTTSYAWYAVSLKVIQSDFNWLQRFAKFLKDQIPSSEWDLCIPTEELFRKETLTTVILNSKDRFLEKLKSLPDEQRQNLALAACCNGYLDLQDLGHLIVSDMLSHIKWKKGFTQPAFNIGDQDGYLMLSDQDLSSALSAERVSWLKRCANSARPHWMDICPCCESTVTTAMHIYLTLQVRAVMPEFFEKKKEEFLPISNELIAASEKLAQETTRVASIKSKALKMLAVQLRPDLPCPTRLSISAKTCHTLSERYFRDLFVLSKMCKGIDSNRFDKDQLQQNWYENYNKLKLLVKRSAIELASIDRLIEHMKLNGPKIFPNDPAGEPSLVICNINRYLWQYKDDFEEKYVDYLIDKSEEMPEDHRIFNQFCYVRDLQGESPEKGKIDSVKALKVLSLIFPEKTDKNLTWQEMIAEWDKAGDPYKGKTFKDIDEEINEIIIKLWDEIPEEKLALEEKLTLLILAGARILTRLIHK